MPLPTFRVVQSCFDFYRVKEITMLSYSAFKHSHMLFIAISILLFQYRFLLKSLKKNIPKILKIIPHINDTLLLLSAIVLVYLGGFNPLNQPWLLAKIIALILYIIFGTLAMKSSGGKSLVGYVLATLSFVFMAMTAINKTPFLIG